MRFEDYAREAGRALSASGRSAEVPSIKAMWTRRRRRGLAFGSAAVVILAAGTVAVVAAVGGLAETDGEVANGADSPVSVPAATVPVDGGGVMFGPPRVEAAETVEFPITLLDGTRLTLTLPRSLADDVAGLVPGGAASWEMDPCCARSLEVIYGSVEDLYGDRQPDVEYDDAEGSPVGFYTQDDDLDHLVFQYGSWVVRAWDGDPGGRRFTEENREMFASLMRGHETSDGFLVLDPAEPMSIGPTDSPDATLTTVSGDGLVGVFGSRECASEGPSADPDLVTSAGNLVSFADSSGMTSICFPDTSLYLWVSRLDLTEAELEAIDLAYLSDETDEVPASTIEGRLPDGTGYELDFDPEPDNTELAGPMAAIVLDLEDDPETRQQLGCVNQCRSVAIGVTTFQRGPAPTSFEQGTFRISSGDWTMSIDLSQDILDLWGDQAEAILTQSIIPLEVQDGLPAFDISMPLRWATDTEIPLQMEVDYRSFVVRRGCGDLSVACSASGNVQVIPAEAVTAPSPPWDHETEVTVTEPTTTTTTTTPTAEDAGFTVSELWTVPGVGIGGTNIGRLPWVLRSSGEMVYVAGGSQETVTGLDSATGEQAWQRTVPGGVVGLLYADSDIVAARGYGLVEALDPISGETMWNLELDGQLWPVGAFRSEVGLHVLVDRPTEGDVAPPQVITVDPADGSVIWTTELRGVEHPNLDLQPHGSALVGDQLLVKSTGALHSLRTSDGSTTWISQFGAVPETYWPTPPLVAGNVVYVADPDGELAALQIDSGEELWRRPIAEGRVSLAGLFDQLLIYTDGEGVHGALATTGETQWSQPGERATGSVVDGRLIVLTRGTLAGFDPATGDRIWSRQANVDIPYGVADLGDTVAAVAEEGIIVARPETGEAAPMIGVGAGGRTSATVAEMPLLTADLVIVAHSDGDITAYQVSR